MKNFSNIFSALIVLVAMGSIGLISIVSGSVNESRKIDAILSDVGVKEVAIADSVVVNSWVEGQELIFMSRQAASGKFILFIEGVQISNPEHLESMNLSGIIGNKYDLTRTYTDVLDMEVVIATLR